MASPAISTSTKRPLNVLIVAESIGSGGTERQLVNLVQHMDPSRVRVKVLYYMPDHFYLPELQKSNVEYQYVPRGAKWKLRLTRRFAKELKKGSIDILHSFTKASNPYIAFTRYITRRGRIILSERGDPTLFKRSYWRKYGWMYPKSDMIIGNSEKGLLAIADNTQIEPEIMRLLMNGLDTDHFSPPDHSTKAQARIALGISPNDIVFLTVATYSRVKNIPGYLNAIDSLDTPAVEALWLWVGRKPGKADAWQHFEDLRRKNKHAEKIRFDGPTSDVLSYYHAADYLVLTSNNEGTPNVVLEAMSCGLPILSTAVGSVPSFVKPGVNGWLVPIKNPPALAEAMIGAMTTKQDVRNQMGQAARSTILEKGLAWKGSAERLMQYYEELNTAAR